MALIDKIDKEEKGIRKQEPAETTYTTGTIDGQRFLQLNMYGSTHRQDVGKASQVVQLNKDSAVVLIELLKQTFSL